MNDDRCQHVPISEGQSMCSCMDVIIWQRTVIAHLCQVIADQERRIDRKPYKMLTPLGEDVSVEHTNQHRRNHG